MDTTGLFVIAPLVLLGVVWIGWDLWVVRRYGLGSGRTISWWIKSHLKDPRVAFLVGLSLGMLIGHFVFGMRCD